MAAAGLVTDEDVADPRVIERVVGRKVGAARESEYDIDTFCLKTFHQGVDCTHGPCLLPASGGD
jgi:hypothetical protein